MGMGSLAKRLGVPTGERILGYFALSRIIDLFLIALDSTECKLPSLSSLLEHPRISETDSFVVCIQIHSPTGPFYPQHPSASYVPRDLLDGLEASLDNPSQFA